MLYLGVFGQQTFPFHGYPSTSFLSLVWNTFTVSVTPDLVIRASTRVQKMRNNKKSPYTYATYDKESQPVIALFSKVTSKKGWEPR